MTIQEDASEMMMNMGISTSFAVTAKMKEGELSNSRSSQADLDRKEKLKKINMKSSTKVFGGKCARQ